MTHRPTERHINPIENYFEYVTWYHCYIFSLVFLASIPTQWHVLSLLFIAPPMNYTCLGVSVQNYCPCEYKDVHWDRRVFESTLQTKFSLYCDTGWMIFFSSSMFNLGLLIGAMVFGMLSDRFGRLSMFCLSCLISGVAGCLVSIMPTARSFITFRMVQGFGISGELVTSFVYCIEYCGLRHREAITAYYHISVNIGHLTIAGVSYFLRDMDDFLLAISVPMFLFLSAWWLLMESPKWLMDKGHLDRAVDVVQKFCGYSGTICGDVRTELEAYTESHHVQKNQSFFKIFKSKKLAVDLLVTSIIYFVCGMGYYGVSQFIGRMSGDIHVNVSISGAVILPGVIASICLMKYCGRRSLIISTNTFGGIMLLIVICIPNSHMWTRLVFACLSNMFIFMTFIVIYLYGVELFPTPVRNSALGFLSVLARIGMIVAPLINTCSEVVAGVTFGVLTLLAAALCFLLPETKDTELPSTFEDTKTILDKQPMPILLEHKMKTVNQDTSSTSKTI